MGGTDPWRAPEGPNRLDAAVKTDIYSFGLLAWMVALNGCNPFDFIVEAQMGDFDTEIVKKLGKLLFKAESKEWLLRYLKAGHGSTLQHYFREATTKVFDRQIPDSARTHPETQDQVVTKLATRISKMRLMASLDDTFDYSLVFKPQYRDLELIVVLLESGIRERRISILIYTKLMAAKKGSPNPMGIPRMSRTLQ